MERILELDFELRKAIANGDGEAAARLAAQHEEAVRKTYEAADETSRESLARQISSLLERNIALAQKVRDNLRAELTTVAQQRKLTVGGATTRPQRSFSA